MLELDDIIDSPAILEIKRALAVKMIMWDLKPKKMSILLRGCIKTNYLIFNDLFW